MKIIREEGGEKSRQEINKSTNLKKEKLLKKIELSQKKLKKNKKNKKRRNKK